MNLVDDETSWVGLSVPEELFVLSLSSIARCPSVVYGECAQEPTATRLLGVGPDDCWHLDGHKVMLTVDWGGFE